MKHCTTPRLTPMKRGAWEWDGCGKFYQGKTKRKNTPSWTTCFGFETENVAWCWNFGCPILWRSYSPTCHNKTTYIHNGPLKFTPCSYWPRYYWFFVLFLSPHTFITPEQQTETVKKWLNVYHNNSIMHESISIATQFMWLHTPWGGLERAEEVYTLSSCVNRIIYFSCID